MGAAGTRPLRWWGWLLLALLALTCLVVSAPLTALAVCALVLCGDPVQVGNTPARRGGLGLWPPIVVAVAFLPPAVVIGVAALMVPRRYRRAFMVGAMALTVLTYVSAVVLTSLPVGRSGR